MRRLLPLLCLLLAGAPLRAQPLPTGLRGVWLTNVDSDVLTSRAKIAEAMDYLAARGFNTVFPVVYNGGYTLFPSEVMAQTFGETYRVHPSFAGRDVLAEVVFEGHRAGLEVIPWFEYGFAAYYEGNGGHILSLKPTWAARCAPGSATNCDAGRVKKNGFFWLDALNPEVQAFMRGLVLEAARKYDVDGIQGDDRLPAMAVEGGYTRVDSMLYAQDFGGAAPPSYARDAGFVQWKARRLTRFLGTLYRGVKAIDPNLTVSMSPSPYSFGYDEYLQDSPRWLDSSYVDAFHPQLYRYDIASYRFEAQKAVSLLPNRARDLPKLSPGILLKAGTQLNGPAYAVDAVRYNRSLGITGEVFFFYEGLRSRNSFVGDSLRKYVYQQPALVPGRTGLRRPPAPVQQETAPGVLAGAWEEACVVPNQPASCVKDGAEGTSLRRATAASGATATYRFTPPTGAVYTVYAYVPGYSANRPDATAGAYAVLRTGADSVVVRVDQTRRVPSGWQALGAVRTTAGVPTTLTVRAGLAADGKATYTDAVLWLLDRQQSPDAVVPVGAEAAPAAPRQRRASPSRSRPTRRAARCACASAGRTARADVAVYDVLGRLRLRASNVGAETDLATGTLAPGVYVVRVQAAGRTGTARLVVAR